MANTGKKIIGQPRTPRNLLNHLRLQGAAVTVSQAVIDAMIAAKAANTKLVAFREYHFNEREKYASKRRTVREDQIFQVSVLKGKMLAADSLAAQKHLISTIIGPDLVDPEDWFLKGIDK